ncbi:ribonuclease H-like domain-containing protein [Tanacetum coccineum]
MSGTQDENPPPPPPPATQQTSTQQTPHTVSTIKLPILKKGEYDIWAMKIEYYLAHTNYPIWEVIQNGNGPVSVTTDTIGQIKIFPPKLAEDIVAKERERKARTTLLMAIPEDHLAKFHKMTDAKEPVGFDKTKVECYNCHKTRHFARECRTKEENRRRDGWNPRICFTNNINKHIGNHKEQ